MKASDYIAEFLVGLGVKDIFLISGGGMMHLLDSLGKNNDLNIICNLNEQASSICADAYSVYTGDLGVCMLTTGPGGTNAVTGIAAAYLDSNPVLAISGQCKTSDFASLRGVRQFGAQEVDIVSVVSPITKYAVKITDKDTLRYHLEKAVYLASHGRKGPVWLDIPLDIQASQVEHESMKGFLEEERGRKTDERELAISVKKTLELLEKAQRPVILLGAGITLSGAAKDVRELGEALGVPMLTTWRAKDVLWEEHSLYFGSPGIPTTRYSNYVLQNCDFLLIVGSRLNSALTAYDEPHFAYNARKVMVDIDEKEINKLDMVFEEVVVADARNFILEMLQQINGAYISVHTEWLEFCRIQKEKYLIGKEKQPMDCGGKVDGYRLAHMISRYSLDTDVWAGSSSGRSCGISHMAVELKKGQRFISSMGLGSMGFTLPYAIAASIASGKRRTLAIEGDGSLQHNIQELQLISTYQLPVKLFVLSNQGYASIYMMQKNNFKSNFAACVPETCLTFPEIKDIAACYHMDYFLIEHDNQTESVISEIMKDDRPVLCEVCLSVYFDEIPKSMTVAHSDGTFTSSALENLFPFLSDEEVKENMPDWK